MALTVLHPSSAREAERLRDEHPGATFVGGGTAWQLGWSGESEATLVSLARLPELRGMERVQGRLRIGGAETLEAVRQHALVRRDAPLLAQACESLAALGIRGVATYGGNLGWRYGDTLAVTLVMGALIEGMDGDLMPVDEWLSLGALPLVVAVHLPLNASMGYFEKVGLRMAFSPSRLALAMQASESHLRVGVTGAGLPGRRLTTVEDWCDAQGVHHLPTRLPTGLSTRVPALLATACDADMPEDPARARLAARMIAGRLGLGESRT